MDITLNNLELPSNLITFTDVPNILKVVDSDGGSYATITFDVLGDFRTHSNTPYVDGLYTITVLGETISNVVSYEDAVNKHFYISNSNISTAASIAMAFRDCQGIATNFNVQHSGTTIILTAKSYGSIVNGSSSIVSTNIPTMYFSVDIVDGFSYSDLERQRINIDVYSNGNYITTLQKNFYNGEAAFNLSPLLTTFAEYGKARPYNMRVSSIINGEYTLLGNVDDNYISVGYMVNQGSKYLINDYFTVAQNYSRGNNRDFDNNTILYLYGSTIPISFYKGNTAGMNIQIDYVDSAENIITSTTSTWRSDGSQLVDLTFGLQSYFITNAHYVDLTLGEKKIRYNVIKPLKATEHYQRILWRNSYGGISFTDWTGGKSIQNDLSVQTYQKNIFDYYSSTKNELDKIYDVKTKTTYTLKSHLFEADGRWVYYDLMQSANVWTEINGETYAIIIDSVSVDETDNNNIYQATVKFHFSQPTSML